LPGRAAHLRGPARFRGIFSPVETSADRLEVDEREEVDSAHARCVERGDNVHFPPEEDRDIEGYHAFFVFDPEGMRIEVLSWPR
jgi:hypothetical protein